MAGHARFACEVNPEVGDQQQEPIELIQPSDSASLDAVEISLALARGGCQGKRRKLKPIPILALTHAYACVKVLKTVGYTKRHKHAMPLHK